MSLNHYVEGHVNWHHNNNYMKTMRKCNILKHFNNIMLAVNYHNTRVINEKNSTST